MTKPKSTYSQIKYKKDGTVKKHGAISKKKFDKKSNRYSKQKGSKSLGTDTSKSQQVVSGKGREGVSGRKSVSRTTSPVRKATVKKAPVRKATVRKMRVKY